MVADFSATISLRLHHTIYLMPQTHYLVLRHTAGSHGLICFAIHLDSRIQIVQLRQNLSFYAHGRLYRSPLRLAMVGDKQMLQLNTV